MDTPPGSARGISPDAAEQSPSRTDGLDMLVNNAEIIKHLNIPGITTDNNGRKLIPEVLNRDTIYEMKFKGR